MKVILGELIGAIKTGVIVCIVVLLVQRFVFTPVKVDGASMYPTLHDEDTVILWEFGYQPKPFDVVVFEVAKEQYYVKRIIAGPGQSILFNQDQLYIDGELIEEPYLKDGKELVSYNGKFTWDFTLQEVCQFNPCDVIPEGYYLVLGDNRPRSVDSRDIGLIHQDQILGQVIWTQWPLVNFGKVE
ncbi:MAG: signal peptidase I [Turicibacter sp.]|nr:signal peptidase I [Turicibacter sp.]